MSQGTAVALGAVAGITIFLGVPVARMRGLSKSVQGFLNAFATGILIFILWDILSHASGPVETALVAARTNTRVGSFAAMVLIFAVGIGAGLLGLVYFNRAIFGRLKHADHTPSPRSLSLAIATGLGLHNLSEGLAIGQSARAGAIAFVAVLVVGFALPNTTDAFGTTPPITPYPHPPSSR